VQALAAGGHVALHLIEGVAELTLRLDMAVIAATATPGESPRPEEMTRAVTFEPTAPSACGSLLGTYYRPSPDGVYRLEMMLARSIAQDQCFPGCVSRASSATDDSVMRWKHASVSVLRKHP
jgi:hypothetical protein